MPPCWGVVVVVGFKVPEGTVVSATMVGLSVAVFFMPPQANALEDNPASVIADTTARLEKTVFFIPSPTLKRAAFFNSANHIR